MNEIDLKPDGVLENNEQTGEVEDLQQLDQKQLKVDWMKGQEI